MDGANGDYAVRARKSPIYVTGYAERTGIGEEKSKPTVPPTHSHASLRNYPRAPFPYVGSYSGRGRSHEDGNSASPPFNEIP